MSKTNALAERPHDEMAVSPPSPKAEIAYATTIATELNKIIDAKKLYSYIQNKKYVQVEGWTTLAALRGCTPRETSNVCDAEGVYVATVELVNAQGHIIGVASAECGSADEVDRNGKPVWANRPAYARRSMANTRATSKVCRQVFSWIMVLAGYAATPAEEVPREGFSDASPAKNSSRKQATEPSQSQEEASGAKHDLWGWDGSKEVFFGKHKGRPWSELEGGYLSWVVENMKDPAQGMAAQEIARRALLEGAQQPPLPEVVEGEVVDDSEMEERFK